MAQIVVVTPNPAVDTTYRVDSDAPGESHRVTSLARRAGGKGLNVSRVLRSLGHSSVDILPLGGWSGDWLEAQLRANDTSFVGVRVSEDTRFTVATIRGAEHPTVFLEPGPTLTAAEQARIADEVRAAVSNHDALVISGSLPPGVPASQIGEWVALARRSAVLSLVDTSGPGLLAAARAGADILKPNREEACSATGTSTTADAASTLLELGAGVVVISDGARGLTAYTRDGTTVVNGIPDIAGNPTGAGDAATAALIAAFVQGVSLRNALQSAASAGAAAVLSPLAGEIDLSAYVRFMTATSSQEESQ